MFFGPPPTIVETEVFATLPEKFRPGATDKRRFTLEGPSFDRDGNLYCVDIYRGRVFRISPAGAWELAAEYDGQPNGLKIHRDGRIFIADRKQGVVVLDPARGAVAPLLQGPPGSRFRGVNDLVFAANGDLYFTDQGQTGLHDPTGRVYRYTAAGELHCLIDNVPGPNGLVFNVRETELFVAATRANAIWRLTLAEPGQPARAGLFVQLFSPGPDGLALDRDGNVAVAHPGLGTVWLFSKRGEPLCQVKSCAGEMTMNLAYGGGDRKTLYITESRGRCILAARMPVAGKTMYSHA